MGHLGNSRPGTVAMNHPAADDVTVVNICSELNYKTTTVALLTHILKHVMLDVHALNEVTVYLTVYISSPISNCGYRTVYCIHLQPH